MIILSLFLATAAIDEEAAKTNLVITSDIATELGLSRQAVLGRTDGKIVDRSGVVAKQAEVVALTIVATNITAISEAAFGAMDDAVTELMEVTNQVPSHAEHVALMLPRAGDPRNLVGEVIEEGSSGVTDWQVVKYSQYLAIPPNRHVEYDYMGNVAIVQCVWDEWDKNSLTHRCTFIRPELFRDKLILSKTHEIIGGPKGFDFGSALVMVDGVPTYTGVWTNSLTGVEYQVENGVILKKE